MKKVFSVLCIVMIVSIISAVPVFANADNLRYGDANDDGKINIRDATHIQKYCAEMYTFPIEKLYPMDYNGDGTININDCTAIQKNLASLSVKLYRSATPFLISDTRDTTPENIPFTFDQLVRARLSPKGSKDGYQYEQFRVPFSSIIRTYDDYIKEDYEPQPKYNEEFFKDNALILLYRMTSSGSDRFRVDNIAVKDGIMYIDDCYVTNKGNASTCDIANYLLYVTVKQSDIENIDKIYITRNID